MRNTVLTLIAFILSLQLAHSQDDPAPLSAAERSEVIDSVCALLTNIYVFPDVAENMAKLIRQNRAEGHYRDITSPYEYAQVLTSDLQSVSHDKHLRVMFAPEQIARSRQAVTPEDSLALVHEHVAQMKRNNFGFREVKVLEGNIGYIDLRSFSNPEHAGDVAVAAMNFIANTDAVIIDLRNNGGGSPEMIQLISSYFFSSEAVHLNNFYWRPSDRHTQTWTLPFVPGIRRPDVDLYILTSGYTFSAAEEFTYNLKNMGRATIVGETTGGGAHPGGTHIATERFMTSIPSGRAINPITNTNWEGTGVAPDIETTAAKALATAQMKALENLIASSHDYTRTRYYEWHMDGLKALNEKKQLAESILKSYVGTYGPRSITLENGVLYYQRTGPKYPMYPMGNDMFLIEDLPQLRFKFSHTGDKVTALIGLYDNGFEDRFERTSSGS